MKLKITGGMLYCEPESDSDRESLEKVFSVATGFGRHGETGELLHVEFALAEKMGTASEVAAAVGVNRTTLDMAMRRDDAKLEIVETVGGTLLVSVASARKWKRKPPKRGPRPKD